MQAVADKVMPNAKWQFNEEVTACFDNMLSRSIPGYHEMRRLVFELGKKFIVDGRDVVDLGCSRGEALARFTEEFGPRVLCVGLDESPAMVAAATERFIGQIAANIVDIRQHDLRDGLPDDLIPSLTLAVLTLQFLPIEYRQRLIAEVYRATSPGGAFIVVEKILGPDAAADQLLVENYYQLKAEHGYTLEQIMAKRKSLENVLVPLPAQGNVAMLEAEGFRVTQFWQHLNFAGWLAIKPKRGK